MPCTRASEPHACSLGLQMSIAQDCKTSNACYHMTMGRQLLLPTCRCCNRGSVFDSHGSGGPPRFRRAAALTLHCSAFRHRVRFALIFRCTLMLLVSVAVPSSATYSIAAGPFVVPQGSVAILCHHGLCMLILSNFAKEYFCVIAQMVFDEAAAAADQRCRT